MSGHDEFRIPRMTKADLKVAKDIATWISNDHPDNATYKQLFYGLVIMIGSIVEDYYTSQGKTLKYPFTITIDRYGWKP